MIEIFKAIILGIIEGITEWLPVSSTGHMILVDEFLKLDASEGFKELFFVVIQLGAILSVPVLFFNKLNLLSFSFSMFVLSTLFVFNLDLKLFLKSKFI